MLVDISAYQYGKVNKRLRNAANWINSHKRDIKKWIKDNDNWEFDYPDYFGMPKCLSYRLDSDEVDFLQSEVHDFAYVYWLQDNKEKINE